MRLAFVRLVIVNAGRYRFGKLALCLFRGIGRSSAAIASCVIRSLIVPDSSLNHAGT